MLPLNLFILLLFGSYTSSYLQHEAPVDSSNDGLLFENGHHALKNKKIESVATLEPSSGPTIAPSENSNSPFISYYPTSSPTGMPSVKVIFSTPTFFPTRPKSQAPSKFPSKSPTSKPSFFPSKVPTKLPSRSPSLIPIPASTASPSIISYTSPSLDPTASPFSSPTSTPFSSPTTNPTVSPSSHNTTNPTTSPTSFPTNSSPTVINYPTGTPTSVFQNYHIPTITINKATLSPTITTTTTTSPTPSPSYITGSQNNSQTNSNNNISNKSSTKTYFYFTSAISIVLFVLIICVASLPFLLLYRYRHIFLPYICGESVRSKLRSSRQQGSKTSGTTDTNTSNTDLNFEPENVDFVFDRQRVLQSTRSALIPSSPARTSISLSSADSPSSPSSHPAAAAAAALTPGELRTRRLSEAFRRNGMELSPLRVTAVRGGGNTSPARVAAAAASKRRSLQFPQFVGGVLSQDYRPHPPPLPEISPPPPPPPHLDLPPPYPYPPNTTISLPPQVLATDYSLYPLGPPTFPSFDPSGCLAILPAVTNNSQLPEEAFLPRISGGSSQSVIGGGLSNHSTSVGLPCLCDSSTSYVLSSSLLLPRPSDSHPSPLTLPKAAAAAPHPPPPPRPPPPHPASSPARRLSEQTLLEIAQARSRLSSRSQCNNYGYNSGSGPVYGGSGNGSGSGTGMHHHDPRPIPLPIPRHLLPRVTPPPHELPDRLPLPELSSPVPANPYSLPPTPSSPSRPSSIMRSPITGTFTSPRRMQQRVSAEGDSLTQTTAYTSRLSQNRISRRFSNNDLTETYYSSQ